MRLHRLAQRTLTAAALILASGAATAWAGVPVQSATEEQREAAGGQYATATEAFEAGRFEDALTGFRASYDTVASPNTHFMIIATLTELKRHVEAYGEIAPALEEAREAAAADSKYEPTIVNLENAKTDLETKIGRVVVEVPASADPGARLTVGGREIPTADWAQPVAVEPGTHVIELTGFESQEVTVEAGAEARVELMPSAPAPEPLAEEPLEEGEGEPTESWFIDNRRTIAYVAGGVGVAGMVLFGAFGGLTLSAEDSLEEACTPEKRCPVASASDIDDGKTYQTVANVGLVVGLVGLTAGVGLFVWDVLDDPEDDEQATKRPLRLSAGAGHLTLEGSF